MDEPSVTVQLNGYQQQLSGRAARIVSRVADLAGAINAAMMGKVEFNFHGDTLKTRQEYHDEEE